MEKAKSHNSQMGDENKFGSYIKGILKGCAVGLFFCAIFILIFSVVSFNLPESGRCTFQFGIVSYLLGSAMCGIFAAKYSGNPFISGTLSATVFALFIIIVSVIMPWKSDLAANLRWGIRLSAIPTGAIMALICVRKNKKTKQKRRRKH